MAVDARGFQLSAAPAGSLGAGIQTGQQLRSQFVQGQEQESQIQRQNQFRQLSAIVADPSRSPQERQAAQQQMMGVAPEQAQQQQQQTIANLSARQKEILTSVANDFAVYSGLPSIEAKKAAAKNNKARLIADNKPTDETDEYIAVLESGDVNEVQRLESGIIQAGQLMGTLKPSAGADGAGVSEVQSSRIMDDGTVQFIRKSGEIEVVPANEVNSAVIEKAQRFGAKIQGIRSGERAEGASSAAVAKESFKRIGNIRKNMANLNKGIRLLDEGAKSGAIEKFLPSIRAASIKLDNLQGELGLDIIGSVTFGALSESELLFAKDVALPKGLDEPELKKWMEDKRAAQQKVVANLEEAAKFLGTPGNTIADFISIKQAEKDEQQQAATQAQPAQALPQGVTEDDITETMRANNMTREQVLQRLGGQ